MRRLIFAASIAAATLIPSIANAQQNCERQRSNQVVGTVAGAGAGAILGNVIAGRGDKTLGTIIGAIGGGVIGNQVAKPDGDCRNAYGYYDENNRWHATGVAQADARGYYDREGRWVVGAPNGYYGTDNRWVVNSGMSGGDGFYGRNGAWIPASANGYYDRNDNWVAGSASGYYDRRGRWIAGATTGRYDVEGRWIAGQASADPQPGYYDTNGRWQVGVTTGYYDSRGRWIVTVQEVRGSDRADARRSGDFANRRPQEILGQMVWLDRYVRSAMDGRSLSRRDGNGALRELDAIRTSERQMNHDRRGDLSGRNEASIQLRLDRLSDRLGVDRS